MKMDNLLLMKEHLENVSRKGAKLYLDGRAVTPEEIAWVCCVNEDDIYMPDIIPGQNGKVAEVRYNKIKSS